MTAPQTTQKPHVQQTALVRRPSLADQQVQVAQQTQGVPVVRALPLDFGDC